MKKKRMRIKKIKIKGRSGQEMYFMDKQILNVNWFDLFLALLLKGKLLVLVLLRLIQTSNLLFLNVG